MGRVHPADLRAWCAGLGQPTFVGSSRRVFPEAFRANPLVRAWRGRLAEQGVRIETRQRWVGWADGAAPSGGPPALLVAAPDGDVRTVAPDVVVLALGGASWPRLGSDGSWTDHLAVRGVELAPWRAANVGLRVAWSEVFVERFAGVPLKHVALRVRGERRAEVRGDAMLTATGVEGGPVYALGAAVRAALDARGTCTLEVDLRPDATAGDLEGRLRRRRPRDSGTTWLRRTLGLDLAAIGLLREAGGGALPADPAVVAALVKAAPVTVTATMPIERAISSAGGVAWSEVDEHLMLRRLPGVFLAGEMLDWEAPTGGYLLQACFSTGAQAGRGALRHLAGGGSADVREPSH
ncbi:TIGR03862 family flavoprotein [Litorihabitans aurantiacus]|uniref:NAD(FAD)-utilizing dehydrogenase n=1 Tax=Litorihabitans aurantiacus TaxID=1930061 RepID=A0AA37UVI7_9MICO|nr:NAD(FAD)-utilizing dehydrogenase [Litorihabitans aurantiacus]